MEQTNVSAPTQEAFLSPRLLGTLGMLGSPMMLVEGFYRTVTHLPENHMGPVLGVLNLLYVIGWMCSVRGMRRLRVTGNGPASAVLFVIQMTCLVLAGQWAVYAATGRDMDRGNLFLAITDAAWPLSHLFMLVVGGFVLKANVWRGWRRAAPFVCGLALPSVMALSPFFDRAGGGYAFGILTTVGFLMLGNAVRTSRSASSA